MECQREESGALLCDFLLFFRQPLILPFPQIYTTTNSVEGRSVFVTLTDTYSRREIFQFSNCVK